MTYPDYCIKGITNETFLIPNSVQAAPNLFQFHKERVRDDGWIEESVNWQDDENAIHFTMNQTKADGSIQFECGVAILPLNKIDELRSRPGFNDVLEYERQTLSENPYHGNILVKSEIHTHQ